MAPAPTSSYTTYFFVTAFLPAVFAVILGLFSSMTRPSYPVPARGSAVVITGTSTGIGRHAAEGLAKEGYVVFAGIRKAGDVDDLLAKYPQRIYPLLIDVTDTEGIGRAKEEVEKKIQELNISLAAIVNNAGIPYTIPVELLPLDKLRQVYEVNVIGVVAVTQAFLKSIRQHQGRIIMVGSAAGFTVPPLYGAYASSKYALEALTDAFRIELIPWNISVSLLEPGTITSEIRHKNMGDKAPYKHITNPKDYDLYGHFFKGYDARAAKMDASAGSAQLTTDAMLHALQSPHPKTRYVIGHFQGLSLWVFRNFVLPFVPDHVQDWVKHRQVVKMSEVPSGGSVEKR